MSLDQVWSVIAEKSSLIPQKYYLSEQHKLELSLSAISEEEACYAGIFTATSQQANDLLGYDIGGLVFLYFTENDDLVTFRHQGSKRIFARIKPNKPFNDSKYLSPKNSGCKIYLPRCSNIEWEYKGKFKSVDLVITEGEKKALSGCVNSSVHCVGLGGINSYRTSSVGKSLGFLQDHLKLTEMKSTTIIADSDILQNKNVLLGCNSMVEHILDAYMRGTNVKGKKLHERLFYTVIPSLDGQKTGIDDLIYKTNGDALNKLLAKKMTASIVTEDKKHDDITIRPAIVPEPLGDGVRKTKINDELNTAFGLRTTMIMLSMENKYYHCSARGWLEYDANARVYKELGKGFDFTHIISKISDTYDWQNRDSRNTYNMEASLTDRLGTEYADWDSGNKIAFANGIYDTEHKTFVTDGNPKELLSRQLHYDYNPDAECPEFEKWLDFTYADPIGSEWEPNPFRKKYVLCLMRYTLTKIGNAANPVEKFVLAWGAPGTGKGTLLEVLREVLGPDNCGQWSPGMLMNPNYLSSMVGRYVSICSDLKGKLTSDICGQLTQIISNEPLMAKKLWKNPVSIRLCTHLWAASNAFHLGDYASSEGLMRRAAVVPHKRKPLIVDTGLKERLLKEAAGIWNMLMKIEIDEAIEYIIRYSNGDENMNALTDTALQSNTIYNWMQEAPGAEWCMCETEFLIPLYLHYHRYKSWTESCSMPPLTIVDFKKELVSLGCEIETVIDPSTGKESDAIGIPKIELVDRKRLLRI